MIRVTRALDSQKILVALPSIIEPAPEHANAISVITVAGQKIGVSETMEELEIMVRHHG